MPAFKSNKTGLEYIMLGAPFIHISSVFLQLAESVADV